MVLRGKKNKPNLSAHTYTYTQCFLLSHTFHILLQPYAKAHTHFLTPTCPPHTHTPECVCTNTKKCYSFIQCPFSCKKGIWGGSIHSKRQRCLSRPLPCHTHEHPFGHKHVNSKGKRSRWSELILCACTKQNRKVGSYFQLMMKNALSCTQIHTHSVV